MTRKLIIGLGVVFVVGLIFGRNTAEPDVKYKIVDRPVVKTKVVTKTERVQADIPEACFRALDRVEMLRESVAGIDRASSDMLDILSTVRLVAAGGDYNLANDTETLIRQIRGEITDAVSEQIEGGAAFDLDMATCRKELG